MSRVEQAVVVGAGVSGLTTAACLAEVGWAVQVWSAEPPRRTTSVVAGALWGPSFQEPMAKTMEWTNQSLADFRALADDPATGVRMAPALTVGDLPAGGDLPPQTRSIPDLRPCGADEVPDGFGGGFRATMPLVDMPQYLDHLVARLGAVGVDIQERTIGSLAEAADAAPVVVNCTGLGSRVLLGDQELRPVFGQHVVLTNPGLDELFMELAMADEWTSYFPHPNRVVCGGVSVPGRTDRDPDPDVTTRILARVRAIEPRLRDAEVIEVVTGLRPARSAVRVEAEPLGSAWCVHNYGHGGTGVSLSWGCAREATALAVRLRDQAAGRR
ncbi:MAG TPA: FAD-dependent oxidoreductase [Actinophytocola sp.]|nr:FAD-dependent oxidoreductase [Actinophytocola sp.]